MIYRLLCEYDDEGNRHLRNDILKEVMGQDYFEAFDQRRKQLYLSNKKQ